VIIIGAGMGGMTLGLGGSIGRLAMLPLRAVVAPGGMQGLGRAREGDTGKNAGSSLR
jgi:hypothetical protein